MEIRGKKWTNETILQRLENPKIQSLDLDDTSADDSVLVSVAEHGCLTSLDLSSDYITDEGIRAVVGGCKLRSLIIRHAPLVTDACLDDIAACSTLRELYLEGTSVTDEGIPAIGRLPSLWSLDISRTVITDVGLKEIASKQIELISFNEVAVTGLGFSTWSTKEKMSFYTEGSHLNDAGFATACKAFPFMWNVVIENTNVTNEGLRALAGQSPAMLRINGSPIDREGVIWVIENVPIQSLEADPSQISPSEAENYERRHLEISVFERD